LIGQRFFYIFAAGESRHDNINHLKISAPHGGKVLHGDIVNVALEETGTVNGVSLELVDLLHGVRRPDVIAMRISVMLMAPQ
jgi:hypothetical protein